MVDLRIRPTGVKDVGRMSPKDSLPRLGVFLVVFAVFLEVTFAPGEATPSRSMLETEVTDVRDARGLHPFRHA